MTEEKSRKNLNKKILLLEDNDTYRETVKTALQMQGYQVTEASTSKLAQNLFGVELFHIVIADVRIPDGTGIQLLHFIKKTRLVPVILMTGFPEFKDPQEAYDLGAIALLLKPFQLDELLKIVTRILGDTLYNLDESDQDDFYCKIHIKNFISGQNLQYDIYIRINEFKYVKIAKQGDNLTNVQIEHYMSKQVTYLYMQKDDFKKYIGFNVSITKAIKNSNTITKEKKLSFLKSANEAIMTSLFLDGVDQETFEYGKTIVESSLSVITSCEDLMIMLEMLNQQSNAIYSHSLGVSLNSTMIAKAVGWTSPIVATKVMMGGLLHDIGKKEIPEEILNKPRAQLTPQEIQIYESHTIRGAEILNKLAYISSDIVLIAVQHHENQLGLGYPAALKSNFIHPMTKLVSVANEFCNLTLSGPQISEPIKPEEAIHKLSISHVDTLDPVFFMGLAEVYKVKLKSEYQNLLKKKRKIE